MTNEPESELKKTGITFNLAFGPSIALPGVKDSNESEIVIGAKAPLWGVLKVDESILATDDVEALCKRIEEETATLLDDLTIYMQSPEYRKILSNHILNVVATYRGTVLRKGIPNRETRRKLGDVGDEFRVDV